MAWTTPKTWAVREKVTAALMNTHLRDNLAWLRGMLDGTGSGTLTTPGNLNVSNDVDFNLQKLSATQPILSFDGNDYIEYNRTANTFILRIAGANKLTLDTNGLLTGAGFFESTEYSVANGATQNIPHGFTGTPRDVEGRYNTVTGDSGRTRCLAKGYTAPASSCYISEVGATNIVVINNTGATVYVKVWARL